VAIARDGLALILGLQEGIQVVGSAIDGADAVRQVASTDPDVVLMDLNMSTLDGAEATRQITDRGLRARVVVLAAYADDDWVLRALQATSTTWSQKPAAGTAPRWSSTPIAPVERPSLSASIRPRADLIMPVSAACPTVDLVARASDGLPIR